MKAEVTTTKQTVTDEKGKVVKELFYVKIVGPGGEVLISSGQSTFDKLGKIEKAEK